MPFTTSGQETESALLLQPCSPHGTVCTRLKLYWLWFRHAADSR